MKKEYKISKRMLEQIEEIDNILPRENYFYRFSDGDFFNSKFGIEKSNSRTASVFLSAMGTTSLTYGIYNDNNFGFNAGIFL